MKKKISDATLGEKKRLGKGEKGRFADPRLLLPATTSAMTPDMGRGNTPADARANTSSRRRRCQRYIGRPLRHASDPPSIPPVPLASTHPPHPPHHETNIHRG